jgi:hypothetical protein
MENKNLQYINRVLEKDGNISHICEICGGKYKYMNKSHHNKTIKHKYAILSNKEKEDLKKNFTQINIKNI